MHKIRPYSVDRGTKDYFFDSEIEPSYLFVEGLQGILRLRVPLRSKVFSCLNWLTKQCHIGIDTGQIMK